MSQTYSLVCHETKKRVWIGQGWGSMESLYSGDDTTLAKLKLFLNDHLGKPLEFVCDDKDDRVFEYEEYQTHLEAWHRKNGEEAYNRFRKEKEEELESGIEQPACGCRVKWHWDYSDHYLPDAASFANIVICEQHAYAADCLITEQNLLALSREFLRILNSRLAALRAKFDAADNNAADKDAAAVTSPPPETSACSR